MSGSVGKTPSKKRLGIGLVMGAVFLVLVLYLVVLPTRSTSPEPTSLMRCMMNLRTLYLCLRLYSEDHGGKYPPAEQWCDVLVGEYEEHQGFNNVFRCPATNVGPCNYAMNPNADPDSAGDVVLLFESVPGWNQFGGPELLVTENHEKPGCAVLFVDASVRFVKADEVAKLRWGDGEIAEGELANVPGSSEGTP